MNTSALQPFRATHAAFSPLLWAGLAMLVMAAVCLALPLLDARTFNGVSVWVKPMKFHLSTGVYLLTLALFMHWLPTEATRSRAAKYVVWAAVLAGLFEVIYVTWQGAHGLASHFNISSRFYATMYSLMGVGAVTLISTSLVLGIVIARERNYALPPALKLAIVLGLVLSFGLGTGFGGYLSAQQAGHWVGGALTDSGGLPLVQWSRSGGDLRVAHFFGLHAMHFLPAIALILQRANPSPQFAKRAVWCVAIAYSAFTVWTFEQARSGTPFWA